MSNNRYRLKKKKRKLFLINLLISTLRVSIISICLYGIYLLWINSFWNIKEIEINNLSKYNKAFINKLNFDKVYFDKNILIINPILLKEELISNKRIFKNVNVERSLFPAKLKIDFFERVPYLNIKIKNKNDSYTIDEDGIILLRKYKEKNYFIIDKIINYQITEDQLKVINEIYFYITNKEIPDNLGLFDISNINDIHLYTKENHVLLGNMDNFLLKIKSIPDLEKVSKNNKDKLKYIDIRFHNNPVLKIEKDNKNNIENKL